MSFDDSDGNEITFRERFGWFIRDEYLGQKRHVEKDVIEACKRAGRTLRGHAKQTYSFMKMSLKNGIATEDEEILDLCKEWGLDPALPLNKQDRLKIKAAWESKQTPPTTA